MPRLHRQSLAQSAPAIESLKGADDEKGTEESNDEAGSERDESDIDANHEDQNGTEPELKKANGTPKRSSKKKRKPRRENDEEDEEKKSKKKKKKIEYEVAQIIDMEINNRWSCPIRFLVRWVGYTEKDDCWVSVANLNCENIVDEFLQISGRKPEYQKAMDKYLNPVFEGYSTSLRARPRTDYYEEGDDDETFYTTSTRTRRTKMPDQFNPCDSRPQLSRRQNKSGGVSRQEALKNQAGREYEVAKIMNHKKRGSLTLYRVRWKGLGSSEDSWVNENDLHCPLLKKQYLDSLDSDQESEENEYEVDSIVDSREMVGGVIMYKVRWKGFSAKHDSWLPSDEMNCPGLVKKYEDALNKLKKKEDWVVETVKDSRIVSGKMQYLVHWYGFEDNADTWEPEENLANCQDKLDEYFAAIESKKSKSPKKGTPAKSKVQVQSSQAATALADSDESVSGGDDDSDDVSFDPKGRKKGAKARTPAKKTPQKSKKRKPARKQTPKGKKKQTEDQEEDSEEERNSPVEPRNASRRKSAGVSYQEEEDFSE